MNPLDEIIEVDELALYFGEPFIVNQYITVFQPTIGQIVKYGERPYYSMVNTITAIPSDMKAALWDSPGNLDWTKIEDFQLFTQMCSSLPQEKTGILLGDLNLADMKLFENPQNGEPILVDQNTGCVIDELAYMRMTSYICKMHNITKKVEKAANEFTKKFMIDEDRQKNEYQKKQPYKSHLLPLISAVKARQGYSKEYVRNMGLVEFYTEVERLQIIVQTDALIQGSYSGMIDTNKIPSKNFDWFRTIEKK